MGEGEHHSSSSSSGCSRLRCERYEGVQHADEDGEIALRVLHPVDDVLVGGERRHVRDVKEALLLLDCNKETAAGQVTDDVLLTLVRLSSWAAMSGLWARSCMKASRTLVLASSLSSSSSERATFGGSTLESFLLPTSSTSRLKGSSSSMPSAAPDAFVSPTSIPLRLASHSAMNDEGGEAEKAHQSYEDDARHRVQVDAGLFPVFVAHGGHLGLHGHDGFRYGDAGLARCRAGILQPTDEGSACLGPEGRHQSQVGFYGLDVGTNASPRDLAHHRRGDLQVAPRVSNT